MKLGTDIILTTKAHSDLDAFYGPYEATEQKTALLVACERIPAKYRALGLTVGIINSAGKVEEYLWKTNDLSDSGLSLKVQDDLYGPYGIIYNNLGVVTGYKTLSQALEEACAAIPIGMRKRGLTVGIATEDDGIVEYQWKRGITDNDLQEKIEGIVSTAELVVPTVTSFEESPGQISFKINYSSKVAGRVTIIRDSTVIGSETIVSGTNEIFVNVPKDIGAYVYRIRIIDGVGQEVLLEVSQFSIKVGKITIKTDLQSTLDSDIVPSVVSTYVTVNNQNIPVHLYINGTLQPLTSFNATKIDIPLSEEIGGHNIIMRAVSYENNIESTTEFDEKIFNYVVLDEATLPYDLSISSIGEVYLGQRIPVAFYLKSYLATQKQITFTVRNSSNTEVAVITPATYFSSFTKNVYYLNSVGTDDRGNSYSLEGEYTILLKIERPSSGYSYSNSVQFNVLSLPTSEGIVSDNKIFEFTATNDTRFGNYTLDYTGLTEGVNGVLSGNNFIRFTGESSAKLMFNGEAYNPFRLIDSFSKGATIEVLYNTKCTGDILAPVLTTFLDGTDTSIGVEVSYKKIEVGMGGMRYSTDVSENSWIHATVVFSKEGFESNEQEDSIDAGYMYIYINGCCVFAEPVAGHQDLFSSINNAAHLSINSDNARTHFGSCDVRVVRFYNAPLTPSLVRMNWTNSIQDVEEKERVIGRNGADLPIITFVEQGNDTNFLQLLKTNSSSVFKKAGNNFVTISKLLQQTDKSLLKLEFVYCRIEYQLDSQSVPVIWNYTTVLSQGTSTLRFPIKNFKIRNFTLDGHEAIFYKNANNLEVFKSEEGWEAESVFTLKCDYMESAHLNNTPTCTYYNNIIDDMIASQDFSNWTYDTVSPARAGYIDAQGNYREYTDANNTSKRGYLDAIKGFPCVVQYLDTNNEMHYLGTFMFNIDKEGDSLGFDIYYKDGNTYQEALSVSIEGKTNTDEGAGSFCGFDYWLANKSGATQTGTDGLGNPIYTYDSLNGYYASEYNNYYKSEINQIPHSLSFQEFIAAYISGENEYYSEPGGLGKRTLVSPNNPNSYYLLDFEIRHIWDSDKEDDPSQWHDWINTIEFVSLSYERVIDPTTSPSDIATIKSNFALHFSVEYCILYYLQMIVFGQADNAGKNCMWDTWGNGEKWFPRPYDQDTMAGLNNSGIEAIDPDVEYNLLSTIGNRISGGIVYTANAAISDDANQSALDTRRYTKYNTSNSRMWVLFWALYQNEIKDTYARMRTNNLYDIDRILNFYFSQTSDIIGEKYYNIDSVVKFILPPGGVSYLLQLHGNRRERFKYWMTTRLQFCDSLFEYDHTSSNVIVLRTKIEGEAGSTSNTASVVFKTYAPVYITIIIGTVTGNAIASADLKFQFYCSPESTYRDNNNVIREGVKLTIPAIAGDKEMNIYGANYIKEIEGISNLGCSGIDLSYASKIATLELLNLSNLTEIKFGNNTYLQTLRCEGLPKMTSAIDLTNASNIKTISLRGSTFGGLFLTTESTGTTAKNIDVSNTAIVSLNIRQAPFLQSLIVDGCSRLESLILQNCNIPSLAFESLPSLRTLKLIDCHYLTLVNVSKLLNLEITSDTFSNCENLESISLSLVHNVSATTKILAVQSLSKLQDLDISDSQGIEQIGLRSGLSTLKRLNCEASLLTSLALPQDSTLEYLNCLGCSSLSTVTGINLRMIDEDDYAEVFMNCVSLTSISGQKLQSKYGNFMFFRCARLELLDIEDIDFTECNTFQWAFSRTYNLPWSEILKCLGNRHKNDSQIYEYRSNTVTDINAAHIFEWKLYDPTIENAQTKFAEVPSNIFEYIPNIKDISYAFAYYWITGTFAKGGGNDRITETVNPYPDPVGRISVINTFSSSLSSVTNIRCLALRSNITLIPSGFMAKLPSVQDARGCFLGTQIINIPSNVFSGSTHITSLQGAFCDCTQVTSNVSNMLAGLTSLTDILGMFLRCTITGKVPDGFLITNTSAGYSNITDASMAFAESQVTSLGRMFYRSASSYATAKLANINSMFANSQLSGAIPSDLFKLNGSTKTITLAGAVTISSAGARFVDGAIYGASLHGGVFANTNITDVPAELFLDLSRVTTILGMFQGCHNTNFPYSIVEATSVSQNFLSPLTNVTNLALAFAASNFIYPLLSGFIPTSATNINGIFAYTGVTNIPSNLLSVCTNLSTAVGAFSHCANLTGFTSSSIFAGLTKLANVSYMFYDCINLTLSGGISADIFKDCTALSNTSYMFSHCERLGTDGTNDTIPLGLFRNNLNLASTANMFSYCYNLQGTIPVLLGLGATYPSLTNTSYMFYRCTIIPKEVEGDYYIFDKFFLGDSDTTRTPILLNVSYMFSLVNNSSNPGIEARFTGESAPRTFKLYLTDCLFYSGELLDVSYVFDKSNLTGAIDHNLFRPALLTKLVNISGAFGGTPITSVDTDFLLYNVDGNYINERLQKCSFAFINTTSLASNIPACKNRTVFTAIGSRADSYKGYAANSSATNISAFDGNWTNSQGYDANTTISVREQVETYSKTGNKPTIGL